MFEFHLAFEEPVEPRPEVVVLLLLLLLDEEMEDAVPADELARSERGSPSEDAEAAEAARACDESSSPASAADMQSANSARSSANCKCTQRRYVCYCWSTSIWKNVQITAK